jgi:uncharacterized protein
MEFEWDEQKRALVFEERGLDLLDAALMFEGPVLVLPDGRKDYGEDRWKAIGEVDGVLLVLVYTEREGNVRLITAWKAGRKDRRAYQARYPG